MTTKSPGPDHPRDDPDAAPPPSFDGLIGAVAWTSPALEIVVETEPGYDWNSALTLGARQFVLELLEQAEPDDFEFTVGDAGEVADMPASADSNDPETLDQGLAARTNDEQPYYFAELSGTVTWTNEGIDVSVWFRPGEDWKETMKVAACEEIDEWTRKVEEFDVSFRLDIDFRD